MKLLFSLLLLSGIGSAQVDSSAKPIVLPGILGKWVQVEMGVGMQEEKSPRSDGIKWIHFLPNNQVEWSVKIGPTSNPKTRRGSYTLSHSGNLIHHSSTRVLLRIDPAHNPAVGGVGEDGTPIYLMDVQAGKGIDSRFDPQKEVLKLSTQHAALAFTKIDSKKDGAGADAAPSTPEEIFADFVSEVAALATNHSELTEFPAYAKSRESKLNISFHRHLNPVTTKRDIRPSDFGRNGILLQFVLDDGSNPMQATIDTVTYFPVMKRTLYANLVLWEKASPELKNTLERIMAKHKAMLVELDKKTANKVPEDTARKLADPQH